MEDTQETVIGFKSARKKMAFGIGKAGTPPSEGVVYRKLTELEEKGFVKILSSERAGTRVKLFTPLEIEGINITDVTKPTLSLEDVDFFQEDEQRSLILEREDFKCFYCFKSLDKNNYVIEHVLSRPQGNNTYKNLVASCRQCNNRKAASPANEFLRLLYREGLLSATELTERQDQLERLRRGELKPKWPTGD